jgi:hypothetical protein
MDQIGRYWKAIIGFVSPGAVTLVSAMQDGSDGGSKISKNEWLTAVIAAVVTSAAVAAKSNVDPKGKFQNESVRPPGTEGTA